MNRLNEEFDAVEAERAIERRRNASTTQDGALASFLLRAQTPEEVAAVLFAYATDLVRANAQMFWSLDGPLALSSEGRGEIDAELAARIAASVEGARRGVSIDPCLAVLFDDGESTIAVLHDPTALALASTSQSVLDAIGVRMTECLAIQSLHDTARRAGQAEQLQRALFAIADLSGSQRDMSEMLRGLHAIIAELMYAANFYIVLRDADRDTLRFIYYVDSVDAEAPAVDRDFPMAEFEQRLTGHLIRRGKALMGTTEELRSQVSGPLHIAGADSLDWLGVPMMRDGEVHGALVVQTYVQGVRYRDTDKALLGFVAEHVLTALERKQSQAELERRVRERTQQLAEANTSLRDKVDGLERAERQQAALYRIAALANSDDDSGMFYQKVHAAVGELLYAENFYIALLSEDGEHLEFPYFVDASGAELAPRPLGRGLTEYVMRRGSTECVDVETFVDLAARGEIETQLSVGQISGDAPQTLCWMGAPLNDADGVFGVIALQSFSAEQLFDSRDAELLTFVAHQIASSLKRRRSADQLHRLNVDLEQRVALRTRELSEQISVRKRVEARLNHQVMHDSLTGLPNRLYMRTRIEQAIDQFSRNRDLPFALLYLDIDRFKVVNDSLGHLAGDDLLKEVSRRLQQCVRQPDLVARLSGDEFAVLIEDVRCAKTATEVAQRILDVLQEPMQIGGRELRCFASIGIAISELRHTTTDALLQDADTALYGAKSAGRRRFLMYSPSLKRVERDVLGIEVELREALRAGQFEPWFQPLLRLADRVTVGYEALLRWNHPERGILLPSEILPVAEECGLIDAIDWHIYRRAMIAGAPLVDDGQYLTINVSPRHFQSDDLDSRLLDLTQATGFEPGRLRVEVTEGTLLGDPEAVAQQLHRLRDGHIEAALDDFGTGYCSLSYLHRFPLRMLKIDRSFVAALGSDDPTRSAVVVGAILALAGSLGLEVVAEGIETEAQHEALCKMGCTYGQGFLYSRAQPAEHWIGLSEVAKAS